MRPVLFNLEERLVDNEVGALRREGTVYDLRMDFGDFVIAGKLTQLKLSPPRRC